MTFLLMSKTTEESLIELEFFNECGAVPNSVAYIPSKSDPSRKYFSKIENHYKGVGVAEVRYCDLDEEFSPATFDLIRSSDAIYLAGGFTPYFLRILQSRNALPFLKNCSITKPIIGVSAGALIMGPDLHVLFDDPAEGEAAKALRASKGLGIYDFEFFPHFGRHENDSKKLTTRSQLTGRVTVGCDDSSALIIGDSGARAVGKLHLFSQGKMDVVQDSFLSKTTLTSSPLSLRSISIHDFSIIREWLKQPHVKDVWEDSQFEESYEEYVFRSSNGAVEQFIIEWNKTPIGYFQFYWAARVGDGWWEGYDPRTVGIDFYLGDKEFLGKGIGYKLLEFVKGRLFENANIDRIIADPSPRNERIVHLLAKAGFRSRGEIHTPDGPAILMEVRRK